MLWTLFAHIPKNIRRLEIKADSKEAPALVLEFRRFHSPGSWLVDDSQSDCKVLSMEIIAEHSHI
jgi:hypothetical protein